MKGTETEGSDHDTITGIEEAVVQRACIRRVGFVDGGCSLWELRESGAAIALHCYCFVDAAVFLWTAIPAPASLAHCHCDARRGGCAASQQAGCRGCLTAHPPAAAARPAAARPAAAALAAASPAALAGGKPQGHALRADWTLDPGPPPVICGSGGGCQGAAGGGARQQGADARASAQCAASPPTALNTQPPWCGHFFDCCQPDLPAGMCKPAPSPAYNRPPRCGAPLCALWSPRPRRAAPTRSAARPDPPQAAPRSTRRPGSVVDVGCGRV